MNLTWGKRVPTAQVTLLRATQRVRGLSENHFGPDFNLDQKGPQQNIYHWKKKYGFQNRRKGPDSTG